MRRWPVFERNDRRGYRGRQMGCLTIFLSSIASPVSRCAARAGGDTSRTCEQSARRTPSASGDADPAPTETTATPADALARSRRWPRAPREPCAPCARSDHGALSLRATGAELSSWCCVAGHFDATCAGLTLLAAAERTTHRRTQQHSPVRSQQKLALGRTPCLISRRMNSMSHALRR